MKKMECSLDLKSVLDHFLLGLSEDKGYVMTVEQASTQVYLDEVKSSFKKYRSTDQTISHIVEALQAC